MDYVSKLVWISVWYSFIRFVGNALVNCLALLPHKTSARANEQLNSPTYRGKDYRRVFWGSCRHSSSRGVLPEPPNFGRFGMSRFERYPVYLGIQSTIPDAWYFKCAFQKQYSFWIVRDGRKYFGMLTFKIEVGDLIVDVTSVLLSPHEADEFVCWPLSN